MAYQMFKGDYGAALRAPDYSGIERAGQAYGEMAKGLGQAAGAAIEKYGLMKEKQKVDKGRLKGLISSLDRLAESDSGDTAHIYAAQKATLENEEIPLSQRLAEADERMKGINVTSLIQQRQLMSEGQRFNNQLADELRSSNIAATKANNELLATRAASAKLKLDLQKAITPKQKELAFAQYDDTIARFNLQKKLRPGEDKLALGAQALRIDLAPGEEELARGAQAHELVVAPLERQFAEGETKLAIGTQPLVHDARFTALEDAAAVREAYPPADQAKDLQAIKSLQIKDAKSLISARDAAAFAALIKAAASGGLPGYGELGAEADKLLGQKVIQISGQSEPVSLMEYYALHDDDPDLYPLTGPGSSMAGNAHAQYMIVLNQAQGLNPDVQVVDPNVGGAAPVGALPTGIDPGMTPTQAQSAAAGSITEIRNRIAGLENELSSLGATGATMPGAGVTPGGGGSGDLLTPLYPVPQSIGYIRQRQAEIQPEIESLKAELKQLIGFTQ